MFAASNQCSLLVFFFYIYFIEAILLFIIVGPGNFCLVHVSLVPVLNVVGEQVYLNMCNSHPVMFIYAKQNLIIN